MSLSAPARGRVWRVVHRGIALVVLTVAALVVVTLVAPGHAQADGGGRTTLTLRPGLNEVGWIGEPMSIAEFAHGLPTSPDAIFMREPQTGRWRVWSPLVPQQLNTLRSIPTGAVVLIRMPDQPLLPWVIERADRPHARPSGIQRTGLVPLVWSGNEGQTLAQAVRGLGDAFAGASQWDSAVQAYVEADPTQQPRAGAVTWLTVEREANWLPPTDEPTRIVWLGEVEPERQTEVRAAIDDARDWFAEQFGVETADFTLYYGDDIDAIIDGYRRYERQWWDSDDSLEGWWRDQWSNGENMVYQRGDHIVFGGEVWGWWSEGLSRASAQYYFRILRARLAGWSHHSVGSYWNDENSVPTWIRQGSAEYAMWLHTASSRTTLPRSERSRLIERLRKITAPLSGVLTWQDNVAISHRAGDLGALAFEWLAAQAGPDSVLEFWRQLAHHDRWQDAFRAAFDISSTDFYRQFESWRADGYPTLASSETYMLSGSVRGPDRQPVADFTLHACPEDARSGACAEEVTDADGAYTFELPADRYMLSAVMDAVDCTVSRNYDGIWRDLADNWTSHRLIDLREGDVGGREIHLSALPGSEASAAWCDRGRPDYFDVHFVSFTGRLTGPDGPIGGMHIHACLDPGYTGTPSGSCYAGVTAANGDFYINLPANAPYQLSLEPYWSRCQTFGWYADGGPTDDREHSRTFHVRSADVADIELELPRLPSELEVFAPC